MSRSITVSCPGNVPAEVQLSYSIDIAESLQTIACAVDQKQFPVWLQLRKFEMQSVKEKNGYVPLFNEINNSRNMATSLFIDQAYTDIMHAEKLKVLLQVA